MWQSSEKRTSTRCNYEAPVTCAYFNSDRFYHAKSMNHSSEGIYFESNFYLIPGASIYIRVENHNLNFSSSDVCRCGGVRQLGVAEVKRCQKMKGENDEYYGIGLKYYEPDF